MFPFSRILLMISFTESVKEKHFSSFFTMCILLLSFHGISGCLSVIWVLLRGAYERRFVAGLSAGDGYTWSDLLSYKNVG